MLLVANPRRPDALDLARAVGTRFSEAGVQVCIPGTDAASFGAVDLHPLVVVDDAHPARGCELVCVIGGDGSILRGAEMARGSGAPLIGVNLGKVGFLAEVEVEGLDVTVDRLVQQDYAVDERMTLEVTVSAGQGVDYRSWALNEVSIEKAARERMLEVTLEVEGRPLSTWGCDGVIVATPTGSTAYAFSSGGPIVWPDVEAILVVPNSAHALFARPIVVGPSTRLAVEVIRDAEGHGILWCDGRRYVDLRPGARIDVARSGLPVLLARMSSSPFTDRLVEKFDLSVAGWRGNGSARGAPPQQ